MTLQRRHYHEDVHRSTKVNIIQKELQRALFTVLIGSSVLINDISGL
jgi:hypothetical protein